jgi:glycosyltransferase involved in cell wall biosynthesis
MLTNESLGDKVEVIICDNASEDSTCTILEKYSKKNPAWIVHRQTTNLGMDGNFKSCYLLANGKFLWLLGDDDRLIPGLIHRILDLLKVESPDLLYINSRWEKDVWSSPQQRLPDKINYQIHDQKSFAFTVNVWLTFISGNIVKIKPRSLKPFEQFQFEGTKLTHLGWILPKLACGRKFLVVPAKLILAEAENTGGYKVFEAFGNNLYNIVSYCLPNRLAASILFWTCSVYIPSLLWCQKCGKHKSFERENILNALGCYKRFISYWLLVYPLAIAPTWWIGAPFVVASRLLKIIHRYCLISFYLFRKKYV